MPVRRSQRVEEPDVPVRRSQRAAAVERVVEEAQPATRPRRARGRRGDTKRRPRGSAGTRTEAPARLERGDRPGRLGRARAFAAERVRRAKPDRQRAADPGDVGAGRASFVVVIMALLVVGVVATLWLSTQAIVDSYRLERAKTDADRLAEQVAVLQREVARLESAPELARRARELGMVPAGDAAWLVVSPDGKVSVVGEPTPVPTPPPTSGAEAP
ncbi:septum formation initiator [Actinokineospora sp. UTMC 2448]|uniref:septum formation initiator n=1 Tax=Actinokineospora sp. UTMC 2448 TaxID=2268449 RepID=UPI0021644D27|nr:septum formation initiator [Actinokineospora sp. UTMC 2448]UVS80954.1 hypothetical protein Actkin_04706 [Actinokineospora sp. UTMC 2448]